MGIEGSGVREGERAGVKERGQRAGGGPRQGRGGPGPGQAKQSRKALQWNLPAIGSLRGSLDPFLGTEGACRPFGVF